MQSNRAANTIFIWMRFTELRRMEFNDMEYNFVSIESFERTYSLILVPRARERTRSIKLRRRRRMLCYCACRVQLSVQAGNYYFLKCSSVRAFGTSIMSRKYFLYCWTKIYTEVWIVMNYSTFMFLLHIHILGSRKMQTKKQLAVCYFGARKKNHWNFLKTKGKKSIAQSAL